MSAARPVPKWVYRMGMALVDQYQRLYRDNELGVQKEVFTPRKKSGMVDQDQKPTVAYFIDGDPTEYATQEAMLDALAAQLDTSAEVTL